jgi:hypothetical protein
MTNYTSLSTCAATGRIRAAALPVTSSNPPRVEAPVDYCWKHANTALGLAPSFEQRLAFEHGFEAQLAQRNLTLAEEHSPATVFFLPHDQLLLALRTMARARERALASFIRRHA